MKQVLTIIFGVLFINILYAQEGDSMKISINVDGKTIIFQLNNSNAAKELYIQLPLKINVENYSDNEKIFYPPQKLSTNNTPKANAKNGTLAYYAPWGNVVIFYKDFGTANGLYEIGNILSGKEHIENISGTIEVTRIEY